MWERRNSLLSVLLIHFHLLLFTLEFICEGKFLPQMENGLGQTVNRISPDLFNGLGTEKKM
jgi:hypothetical protein